MDTLRGNFGNDADPLDGGVEPDIHEDETGREDPPAAIGTDERRMQVRAYNHWAGLLEDRNFPSIEDLDPDALPDFGPYSVLLDFSTGIENPGISYLGAKLAEECDADTSNMAKLDDIPARSLLSRITDHYMQILANQAPIGFEAEFVNQRSQTILYRGILLPFSSDDDTIDFIYGVINWKELADPETADELLLQIDQALDETAGTAEPVPGHAAEMTDWADGPASPVESSDEPLELTAGDVAVPGATETVDDMGLPLPAYGDAGEDDFDTMDQGAESDEDELDYAPDSDFVLEYDDEDEEPSDEYGEPEEPVDTGSFASLTEHLSGLGSPRTKKTATELGVVQSDPTLADEPISDGEFDLAAYGLSDDDEELLEDEGADDAAFGSLGALLGGGADDEEAIDESAVEQDIHAEEEDFADDAVLEDLEASFEPAATREAAPAADTTPENEPEPEPAFEGPLIEAPRPEDMELGDWLAVAREQAEAASVREDRSRAALYEAVGRAHDFALAARQAPEDFAELVEDYGLTMQDRAPMTPVVKLVFGADYDKTRITEYATVLTHAERVGVGRGELADYLARADGGLKGVVAEERAWKREKDGKPAAPKNEISKALAKQLRALPVQHFSEIASDGQEFALVAIRRLDDGTIAVIGEVPHDAKLVTKAARSLLDR
ncbi:hypothetical protein [Alteriqipengyuania sp. WL0013]|uniref:hypothetical protein n=1 Tax=Alteriqipengyuania sp. WL0013 TaxID=3110773 RepID=UPI003A5CBCC3